jgi:hypothetical protein
MFTVVNREQNSNADAPMVVTPVGMATVVKAEHWENKPSGIAVRFAGKDTLVKFRHPENAYIPIFVTPIGMVIEVNTVLSMKADGAMATTGIAAIVSGIVAVPKTPV